MKEEDKEEKEIRDYLLGALGDEGQERVEKRLLGEDDFFERVLVAEDELVDDYLEGSLPAGEREQFEKHFLIAPERRQKLRFAAALRRHVEANTAPAPRHSVARSRPSLWQRLFSMPAMRLAAAAVVILAGVGVWWLFFYESNISRSLMALNDEIKSGQRRVEARITGIEYAPYSSTRGVQEEKANRDLFKRAGRLIENEYDDEPSPEARHVMGRIHLARQEFLEAIEQLEAALEAAPNNAQIQNDLGAAYLEIAKATGGNESARATDKALGLFNSALKIDGSLLPALFNRALTHEQMKAYDQAAEDWQSYIEKDPKSEWAGDARRHLDQIQKMINRSSQDQERLYLEFIEACEKRDDGRAWSSLRQSYRSTGNAITERLIDEYLTSLARNQPAEAEARARQLTCAAEIERSNSGDRFLSDLVNGYLLAGPRHWKDLVRARSSIKTARKHIGGNLKTVLKECQQAREIFERHGNKCGVEIADYWMGYGYLRQPRLVEALSTFERLAQECQNNGHAKLLGRTYNAMSDAHFGLNNYSIGLDYSLDSLRVAEENHDLSGVVWSLAQLAMEYRKVGDYSTSLVYLGRCLSEAETQPVPASELTTYYGVAASIFALMELHSSAVCYQRESLEFAKESEFPLLISRAQAHLGLIYGKIKSFEEAIEQAHLSANLDPEKSDEEMRRDVTAYSALILGHIYRWAGDFEKAVEHFNRNIQIYDDMEFPAELFSARKGKLLCLIALGDFAAAGQECDAALALLEEYRDKISEEDNRNTFFDTEQDIYDVAVGFEYSSVGNARKAFELSESYRARSLLDMAGQDVTVKNKLNTPVIKTASPKRPFDLEQIKAQMPEQTQIVQYAALEDRLLIFVISKSIFEHAGEEISLKELSKRIDSLRRYVETPSDAERDEARDDARFLFERLIKPVERHLDKNKHLYIVPDKSLNYLPFDALLSPESGRYLLQDYACALAPSATMFVKCSNDALVKTGRRDERFLSVGDPSFDRVQFPGLEALPSSGFEANRVAELYTSSVVLTGPDARERQVKQEMAKASTIHLATHYVRDRHSPMLSKFLLAKEPGGANQQARDDGLLQGHEVATMRLAHARVAILAGCQTGIDREYRGEGAVGVARHFLAATVPVVVASLWPVDSAATSKLMINFHKLRKQNSTIEALRKAKLEMLDGDDPLYRRPYYWAPFTVIGGHATF
jgi:CHAT domain-containing protein/TolA-binding protein